MNGWRKATSESTITDWIMRLASIFKEGDMITSAYAVGGRIHRVRKETKATTVLQAGNETTACKREIALIVVLDLSWNLRDGPIFLPSYAVDPACSEACSP